MGALRTARVASAALVWRSLPVAPAGRTLARTLAADSEQDRTIAGMALVQAGERSVPHLEATVRAGRVSRTTVLVLADIGGPAALSVLRDVAAGSGPTADLAAARAAALSGGDPGHDTR